MSTADTTGAGAADTNAPDAAIDAAAPPAILRVSGGDDEAILGAPVPASARCLS